jgi:hypothetical protein
MRVLNDLEAIQCENSTKQLQMRMGQRNIPPLQKRSRCFR